MRFPRRLCRAAAAPGLAACIAASWFGSAGGNDCFAGLPAHKQQLCCDPMYAAIGAPLCFPEGTPTEDDCCERESTWKPSTVAAGRELRRWRPGLLARGEGSSWPTCPPSRSNSCLSLANDLRHEAFSSGIALLYECFQTNSLQKNAGILTAALHYFEALREAFCQLSAAKCAEQPEAKTVDELWAPQVLIAESPFCEVLHTEALLLEQAGLASGLLFPPAGDPSLCGALERSRDPPDVVYDAGRRLFSALEERGLLLMPGYYTSFPLHSRFEFALFTSPALTPACDLSAVLPPLYSGDFQRPWLDSTGHYAPHLDMGGLVDILLMAGVPLARFVVNLGSYDGSCRPKTGASNIDVANCLVEAGYSGILVEGSERAAQMESRFGDREDVYCVSQFIHPDTVMADLRKAHPCGKSAAEEPGASFEIPVDVDLLKVDVDNSDCSFVEALVSLRPKLVHAEFNPLFPPGMYFKQNFVDGSLIDHDLHYSIGCSLDAFKKVLPGYVLLQVEFDSAVFVRPDLAALFPSARKGDLATWKIGYFCSPLARTIRRHESTASEDLRRLADEELTLERRVGIAQEFLHRALPADSSSVPSYTLEVSKRPLQEWRAAPYRWTDGQLTVS